MSQSHWKSLLLLVCSLLVCTAAALHVKQADEVYYIPGYGPLLSRNYAGYVTAYTKGEMKEAYYWLVESESNPSTDPVILWMNGGPGCSSLLGLFTEIGPYTFRRGGLARNEYRWTTNATVIFIDSPGGVGFSSDPINGDPWDDSKTSEYNYNALLAIMARHPQFRGLPFHLAGESYAGHYVPQLAERIFLGSDDVLRKSMGGWMVGNPCTGDIGCTNPDPTLDVFLRGRGFLPLSDRFQADTSAAVYDPYDILVPTCLKEMEMMVTGGGYNQSHLMRINQKLNRKMNGHNNNNNMRAPPQPYGPCSEEQLTQWINRIEVKAAIHANPNIQYTTCGSINYNPVDVGTSVVPIYQRLMDNTNWNIMIYSGTADSIVNFIQTETIVNGMGRAIVNNVMRPWNYVDMYDSAGEQLGGFYLQFDRISWASVRGAGHMVPMYVPQAGKELLNSYLAIGRPGRLGGSL
eukprot:Tbor_TRINITY_DN5453_c0_g1::TRINITY_DN5453_c0_g1_i2::g.25355::m.25355/K16297/SCPL-II; serine carboxypeptidase-like clade II